MPSRRFDTREHFVVEDSISDFYSTTKRHWEPGSEAYTGGDSLKTALSRGWTLGPSVVQRDTILQGSRTTTVFYFTLTRGEEQCEMRVVSNPYVVNFIAMTRLRLDGDFDRESLQPELRMLA